MSDPTAHEIQPATKQFIHDIRNRLNGIAMETTYLNEVIPDDDTKQSIDRIQNETRLIERDLLALNSRVASPDRTIVPARDVFQLWKSSGQRITSAESGTWTCTLESGLIEVDMRMVANLLGELLPLQSSAPYEILVQSVDDGVSYEVRCQSEQVTKCPSLPGFENAVSNNGGKYQRSTNEATGECVSTCWFPVANL
ncbi:MAG: hypothetical protein P1U89_18160 [Verrucomicrobiales bacterium]|nr:hypothetical protein [Verrucomicrobiales bacterium]